MLYLSNNINKIKKICELFPYWKLQESIRLNLNVAMQKTKTPDDVTQNK